MIPKPMQSIDVSLSLAQNFHNLPLFFWDLLPLVNGADAKIL